HRGLKVDAVVSEAFDHAVLDRERPTGNEVDPVGAGIDRLVDAVDAQVAQDDAVVRAGVDGEARGAAGQNRGDLAAAAVERDGFGDRQGAEPARIERVDL